MRAYCTSSGCAGVEALESRCLLSAAPVSVTAAMVPGRASLHTHPTYPSIIGTFGGTYAASNGQTGNVIITLSSEGKTGRLAGTLTIVGTGTLGITGTVSVKGKFAIHGTVNHFSIALNGTVAGGGKVLAGKFSTHARHGSAHGTFTTAKT